MSELNREEAEAVEKFPSLNWGPDGGEDERDLDYPEEDEPEEDDR